MIASSRNYECANESCAKRARNWCRTRAYNNGLQAELNVEHGLPPPVYGEPPVTAFPIRSLVLGRQTGGREDGYGSGDQALQVVVEPSTPRTSPSRFPVRSSLRRWKSPRKAANGRCLPGKFLPNNSAAAGTAACSAQAIHLCCRGKPVRRPRSCASSRSSGCRTGELLKRTRILRFMSRRPGQRRPPLPDSELIPRVEEKILPMPRRPSRRLPGRRRPPALFGTQPRQRRGHDLGSACARWQAGGRTGRKRRGRCLRVAVVEPRIHVPEE